MGFFGDLGKALIGKPVGQVSSPAPEQQDISVGKDDFLDEHGFKIIPRIAVENLRSHRQDDYLTVTARIENNSDFRIRIDYCTMLKLKKQFNQDIWPQQSHDLILYQGPLPHDENIPRATFVYRMNDNGKMFQINYRIGYHLESDGARTISNLFDDGPVREI